jgi:hypothetical protein
MLSKEQGITALGVCFVTDVAQSANQFLKQKKDKFRLQSSKIKTWCKSYKTFYGRNLQMFGIS